MSAKKGIAALVKTIKDTSVGESSESDGSSTPFNTETNTEGSDEEDIDNLGLITPAPKKPRRFSTQTLRRASMASVHKRSRAILDEEVGKRTKQTKEHSEQGKVRYFY